MKQQGHVPEKEVNIPKWKLKQSSIPHQGNNKEAKCIWTGDFGFFYSRQRTWIFFWTLRILNINSFQVSCIAKFPLFLGECIFLLLCKSCGVVSFPARKENCLITKTVQKQNANKILYRISSETVKRTSVILSDENQNWLQTGKQGDWTTHQTIFIFLLMLHHFRPSTQGIVSPLNFNSSSTARQALILLHVKYLAHFQPQQQKYIPVLSCLDTSFPAFGSMSHPARFTKLNSGPQKQWNFKVLYL